MPFLFLVGYICVRLESWSKVPGCDTVLHQRLFLHSQSWLDNAVHNPRWGGVS